MIYSSPFLFKRRATRLLVCTVARQLHGWEIFSEGGINYLASPWDIMTIRRHQEELRRLTVHCVQHAISSRLGGIITEDRHGPTPLIVCADSQAASAATPTLLRPFLPEHGGGGYSPRSGIIGVTIPSDFNDFMIHVLHEVVHCLQFELCGMRDQRPWLLEGHAHVAVHDMSKIIGPRGQFLWRALRVFRFSDPSFKEFDPRDLFSIRWDTFLAMNLRDSLLFRCRSALFVDFILRAVAERPSCDGSLSSLRALGRSAPNDAFALLYKWLGRSVDDLRRDFFVHCATLCRERDGCSAPVSRAE